MWQGSLKKKQKIKKRRGDQALTASVQEKNPTDTHRKFSSDCRTLHCRATGFMGFEPPRIISTTHTRFENVKFMCKLVLLLNIKQLNLHNVEQGAGKANPDLSHEAPQTNITMSQNTRGAARGMIPTIKISSNEELQTHWITFFKLQWRGAEWKTVWGLEKDDSRFSDWKRRTQCRQNSPSVCSLNEHRGEYKGKMWFPARHDNECSQTQTSPVLSEQGFSCDNVCIHYFPTGLFMNVLNWRIRRLFTFTLESMI